MGPGARDAVVDGIFTCMVMEAGGAMVREVVADPEPAPPACGGIVASELVSAVARSKMIKRNAQVLIRLP